MVLFKTREMIKPFLATLSLDLRVLELKTDVLEVIPETIACQPLHILENKGLRLRLTHCTNGLGKHIARVIVSAVLTAQREGLARWPTGDELHLALEFTEIHFPNVAHLELPAFNGLYPARLIFSDGVATILVALDHAYGAEARLVQSNREPSGSGE